MEAKAAWDIIRRAYRREMVKAVKAHSITVRLPTEKLLAEFREAVESVGGQITELEIVSEPRGIRIYRVAYAEVFIPSPDDPTRMYRYVPLRNRKKKE